MSDLRDYRWSISGLKQITEDLELNNPNFLCQSVYYRAQNKIADIELIFWEDQGVFRHSRTFSIPVEGPTEGLDKQSVKDAINTIFTDAIMVVT
jgi:hypothetical protein